MSKQNIKKQKLELTWIGKEKTPKLEPRILLEDSKLSYHAKQRYGENDIFDNILIHGDNLLALRALEADFAGKVKCIYIDPPFNTGQAFEHYDDGLEHSIWLSLIRDRIEILRKLLSNDGTLFVHIDDNELGYLIVLLDEIFGRANRVETVTFKQGSATGHKAINPGCVTTTNFVLVYAKNKTVWTPNKLYTKRERNKRYNQFIINKEQPYKDWKIITLNKAFSEHLGLAASEIKKLDNVNEQLDEFVLSNAEKVIQFARPNYNAVSAEARKLIDASKANIKEIYLLERENYSDMYFLRGERILFYSDTLKNIDGECVSGEPLTNLWDDIPSHNLHNEGSIDFPKGKKPEALIQRCINLCTNPGDLVLDSFGGSGTTGAVAHKMGRRWIMVELGEHCHTHIAPRLKKVIDGEDQGGISKAVEWRGGGGFRYYNLAPSMLEKDRWGNWIISKEFNPAMLSEALCKIMGFKYAPSDEVYWIHGASTETDFIYVTTQTLDQAQLATISEEVGADRTLLICCGAFRAKADEFPNLTLKKIPRTVLNKCEWGKDDYSLNVQNLPMAKEEPEEKTTKKNKPAAAMPLFEGAEE